MPPFHETAKPASENPDAIEGLGGQHVALNDLHHPLNRNGYALWQATAGARRFPARVEFTPRILRDYLRNLALVRVLDGGKDFEFRIVGDAIVSAQGGMMQGHTCSELDVVLPGYGMVLGAVFRRVCETKAPLALRGAYVRRADDMAILHESLVLPLGADETAVDHILVLGVYGHTLEELLHS